MVDIWYFTDYQISTTVSIHAFMHAFLGLHACMHRAYIHAHICMMNAYMHASIIHTHTHARTHTHTHTHTQHARCTMHERTFTRVKCEKYSQNCLMIILLSDKVTCRPTCAHVRVCMNPCVRLYIHTHVRVPISRPP